MNEYYQFFENLFKHGIALENIYCRMMDDEDCIINYEEKELYKLLMENDVKVSIINQIIKLYKLGYPLTIEEAISFSIDDLRSMVKDQERIQEIYFDIKMYGYVKS